MDYSLPYNSARSPVFGREAVATSHPLATMAGMDMLGKGGNAVDAALAAAMALTVVEPTGCGVGSDAFAILHDGRQLHGLNSSGRSPRGWSPAFFAGATSLPTTGWNSVTVPGAVAAWVALSKRFGRLDLATVAGPAIGYARHGHMVAPFVARRWSHDAARLRDQPGFAEHFLVDGRSPGPGQIFRSPVLADTLERIAGSNGKDFYEGALAEAIARDAARHGAALTFEDLAAHTVDWVEPLQRSFAGVNIQELPPNGQGIATLMALGILESHGPAGAGPDDPDAVHALIEACKIALADLYRHVGDIEGMAVSPQRLLDPRYLAARARLLDPARAGDPGHGTPSPGGTVCLAAADADGMMVSFIQSNYMGFGSGIVVPETGISLQNRGASFTLQEGHPNRVGPRKRPFHTIIPGFATTADGAPLMAFGLMGGPMQAQGHAQLADRIFRFGQNPQAAADAPRWRILSGRSVAVEASMEPALIEELEARGHRIVVEEPTDNFAFGGAQIILRTAGGYVAGSDPRKDGMAAAR